jgi:hypothetical protein
MALFRRLFNWRMPAGLVEISGNILGACPLTSNPPFHPFLRREYAVFTVPVWDWVKPARLLARSFAARTCSSAVS